jgi:hypothetical protein
MVWFCVLGDLCGEKLLDAYVARERTGFVISFYTVGT